MKTSARSARQTGGFGVGASAGLKYGIRNRNLSQRLIAKQQSQRQHDPLQSQIAAFGQKPFVGGMGFATSATGADRDRRDIEGERNVGVGGRAVEMGANSEMSVDSPYIRQDGGAFRQPAGGPRTDLLQLGHNLAAGGALVLHSLRPFHGRREDLDQAV